MMEGGTIGKSVASLIVLALMVPGLFFEPGPLSEVIGFAALGAIWDIGPLEGDT